MKVPSFFHSMCAGVAASLCAEQLRKAEFPRMASVSWGSTVNQKGLKGCTAEAEEQQRGEVRCQHRKLCQVHFSLNANEN